MSRLRSSITRHTTTPDQIEYFYVDLAGIMYAVSDRSWEKTVSYDPPASLSYMLTALDLEYSLRMGAYRVAYQ